MVEFQCHRDCYEQVDLSGWFVSRLSDCSIQFCVFVFVFEFLLNWVCLIQYFYVSCLVLFHFRIHIMYFSDLLDMYWKFLKFIKKQIPHLMCSNDLVVLMNN